MQPLKNPIAEQSRQWLIQSLLDLMGKKEYSNISVSEIAEHAQLSRRTFYRIFNSKEEMLEQYFLAISNEYVSCFDKGSLYSLEEIIVIFFTFCDKHIEFLKLLQKNHLLYYLLEQFNLILPTIHDMVRGEQKIFKTPLEKKISLLASAGALWNILSEWLQMEDRPSPEKISQIILTVIERNNKE